MRTPQEHTRKASLLHPHDDAPGVPQRLQVVVAAFLRREEVDDYIAKVDQHPAVTRLSFDTFRHASALLLGAGYRRLAEGTQLWFGFASADDKEVGEDGLHVDIEDENIDALLVQ